MAARSIESPTLAERFVSLIPLPYPLAAVIWAAILQSGFLFFTIQYLSTGATGFAGTAGAWTNSLLNFAFALYVFLMVRYMRLRVVSLGGSIAPRLQGGASEYQRAFRRMTQSVPVLVLTGVWTASLVVSYAFSGILGSNTLSIVGNVVVVLLDGLAFTTYAWVFVSASVGLHTLGGSSLSLVSAEEDRMMGSGPMGRLALSLAVAYFGALLIGFLLVSTFAPFSVAGFGAFVAVMALGVVLFFLPLNRIHSRMRTEKQRLLEVVAARYPRVDELASPTSAAASRDDLRAEVARLVDLQAVSMLEKKVRELPTWPFDVQVTSRFAAIVVSVTAVLVARVITDLLHI